MKWCMMFEKMSRVTLVLVFAISSVTVAIKVPVAPEETKEVAKEVGSVKNRDSTQNKPVYYAPEESTIDSYLLPPDPHRPNAEYDAKDAPQTRLVPPSLDNKNDYFQPEDTEGQSDWLPILPVQDASSSTPSPINNLRPSYQQQIQMLPRPHLRPHLPHRPLRLTNGVPIHLSHEDAGISFAPGNNRVAKQLQSSKIAFPIPSRQLEPPYSDHSDFVAPTEEQQIPAVNTKYSFKVPKPALELELPRLKPNEYYNPLTENMPLNYQLIPAEPTLALHLTPPKPLALKYDNPTKLFPKKYTTGFKPVPIPIAQFADDTSPEVPKAFPLKPFKPTSSIENEYYDAKKIYKIQQAQEKRKLKAGKGAKEQEELDAAAGETNSNESADTETSETIFMNPRPAYPQNPHAIHAHPGRNSYSAPLRVAPPRAPAPTEASIKAPPAPPPTGERTEFRMHGMNGPHSYQFGYDTGKGKNRQFRFEERDNDGNVKGHYGYMEQSGKLRVVNYKSDPENGFQADAPVDKE